MKVRWGLEQLPGLLEEVGVERPFLVASPRWEPPVEVAGAWREVPSDRIGEAAEAAAGADGLLALGGGSAIDLTKAVSAETGLPMVSVPTTYSGAEWTSSFGIRDQDRRIAGSGSGANLAGILYEPKLTLELPLAETVGTAMNALAHSAEALYVKTRDPSGDEAALAGARGISHFLPEVVADLRNEAWRSELLESASLSGFALSVSGLGLGHAMAQALGGLFGLPHGAMNAITLPPALRFNEPVAAVEIARFGQAMGAADPIARVEELARLAGYERLRNFGIREEDLDDASEAAALRSGSMANPRPASAADIAELMRSVW